MDYSHLPMSELDPSLIQEMVDLYRDNKVTTVKDDLRGGSVPSAIEDPHSIWFSLVAIKEFIYHVEHNARKNDCNIKDSDLGLRIYYSRYPKKSTWNNMYSKDLSEFINHPEKKLYEYLHTVIMMPTIRRGEDNVDFNPKDLETFNKMMSINEEIQNTKDTKYIEQKTNNTPVMSFNFLSDLRSHEARNHGSVIPPGRKEVEAF